MLNYMGAELYKLLRRKYLYIFTAVILAGEALLVSGAIFNVSHGATITFYDGGINAVLFLSLGLYLLVIVSDLVFSDQYKHNTLKNEVSFGIPRTRIFLGKLFVEILLGIALMIVFLGFYLGLCYLTLYKSPAEEVKALFQEVGYCVLVALPQWIGMLCVCHTAYSLLRSAMGAGVAFVALLLVPENASWLFGLMLDKPWLLQLQSLMPVKLIDTARTVYGVKLIDNVRTILFDWGYVGRSWGMGAFWAVLSLTVGLIIFRKKEIS